MTKVVFEPVLFDVDAPSPFETYCNGLETAKLLDSLNFELNGTKTHNARDWRRKYWRKFGKKEA